MLLETDGSLAWLYFIPQMRSSLYTLRWCWDKLAIFCRGQKSIVDHIARQIQRDASPQKCYESFKNLFQVNVDQKGSWPLLTPEIPHKDKQAVFAPKISLLSQRNISLNRLKHGSIQKENWANFGRYPNKSSIKECFAKFHARPNSFLKCKQRTRWIHKLSTANRLVFK